MKFKTIKLSESRHSFLSYLVELISSTPQHIRRKKSFCGKQVIREQKSLIKQVIVYQTVTVII